MSHKVMGLIGRKDRRFRRVEHIPSFNGVNSTHIMDSVSKKGLPGRFFAMRVFPHPADADRTVREVTINERRIVYRDAVDTDPNHAELRRLTA